MDHAEIERLRERATSQAKWLRENHPEVVDEQKQLDEGSVERAYWHYGYMVALRDVIKLIEKSN